MAEATYLQVKDGTKVYFKDQTAREDISTLSNLVNKKQDKLSASQTVSLESNTPKVVISSATGNAIIEKSDGLYVEEKEGADISKTYGNTIVQMEDGLYVPADSAESSVIDFSSWIDNSITDASVEDETLILGESSNASSTGSTITINGTTDTVVDATVRASLDDYQDKLTAGSGITISDDGTISLA